MTEGGCSGWSCSTLSTFQAQSAPKATMSRSDVDVRSVRSLVSFGTPSSSQPGGYGGRDRDWADHFPWYWDETEPPGPGGNHADRGNQLDVNIEDEILFLSDAPDGAPGTELSFRTYLTGVPEQGSDPVFLGGWGWDVEVRGKQVTVGEVERLEEDAPTASEFEEILAGSSCPA